MSYHSAMDWNASALITPGVVVEVIKGLRNNREYSRGMGHDTYACCYWVMSSVDMAIDNIGRFLDAGDFAPEALSRLVGSAPGNMPELVTSVLHAMQSDVPGLANLWRVENDEA